MTTTSISDNLVDDWNVPQTLSKVHVINIIRLWLDYARQSMSLKFMVADIVQKNMRSKCQKCREKFRL